MSLHRIVEALRAGGWDPTPSGESWRANCPAHGGSRQSLSIDSVDDKVLLHCHSKECSAASILHVLGLNESELFAEQSLSSKPLPVPSSKPKRVHSIDQIERFLGSKHGKIEACYDYRDENNYEYMRVYRLTQDDGAKTFRPVHRVDGGWVFGDPAKSGLKLYRLPEILHAETIFVVEGEKCVDALNMLGFIATTSAHGARSAKRSDWAPLAGKHLVVCPDNDPDGQKYAESVIKLLGMLKPEPRIKILTIEMIEPNLADSKGYDIADWIEDYSYHTAEIQRKRILSRVDSLEFFEFPSIKSEPSPPPKIPTQSDILGDLLKSVECWRSVERDLVATVPVNCHYEHHDLEGDSIASWLRFSIHERMGIYLGKDAIEQTVKGLQARAEFKGEIKPFPIRVGEIDGKHYVDLGDPSYHAIEIDRSGWRKIKNGPCRFRRSSGTQTIAEPVGSELRAIEDWRDLTNLKSDEHFLLVIAWIVNAILGKKPFPILVIEGEQGSAKTTLSRMIKRIVDPQVSGLRLEPRSIEDLVIACRNTWMLGYDNISKLPFWLTDFLCSVSTEGGYSARKLYSRKEEVHYTFCRPILINGISDVSMRQDFLRRVVLVDLPNLDPATYRSSGEIWEDFGAIESRLLGGIYALCSSAISIVGDLGLPCASRLPDFVEIGEAVARSLGYERGFFQRCMDENAREIRTNSLEASDLARAIIRLASGSPGATWEGTASELWSAVREIDSDFARSPKFPRDGRSLSVALKRDAPLLRDHGVTVSKKLRKERILSIRSTKSDSF